MNCWSILGLDAHSDVRSIKRRYAALLKQNRPDEDPAGFQRLRDAYEQALSRAAEAQEQPMAQQHPLLVPVSELSSPAQAFSTPDPKRQRADVLLEGISTENLDQRLELARATGCEQAFEEGLLEYCQSDDPEVCELAERAIGRFQWLSAWQRIDLPLRATNNVLNNLLRNTEQKLAEALNSSDAKSFSSLYLHLDQAAWMQTLDRRIWLNRYLAGLLAHSEVWSSPIFDAVCEWQGWKKPDGRAFCPEPFWSRLLARSRQALFLEEQHRLATQKIDSTGSRAARLLFVPMSDDARVSMTIRFTPDDWQTCESLANTVARHYPDLASHVPGKDLYFWRPLRRRTSYWALPFAIIGAASMTAWQSYYRLGSGPSETMIALLLIIGALGLVASLVYVGCQTLGVFAWRLDEQLTKRLGRWLTLRRPVPLLLRESTVSWLPALPAYLIGGWKALLVYTAILAVAAAGTRIAWPEWLKQTFSIAPGSPTRELMIGTVLGLTVSLLFISGTVINYRPVQEGQGLQAWPKRLCAALLDANQPCRPPSREQWYAPASSLEAGHDQ
ncbi:J domain-containing protein [Pseudomonas syringae pv. tagetis]|uniref:J domain-containing protein n=1 Tax=Pseudomonas syringae pv. tagetis TaxID=129140 RepID=A0A0Q0B8Y0_9PSED|nr:J domain-containing protein [Pseudomonas syringae group genomosp. 7]KPY89252.1 DnaJ domain-containing protein [Pseudomonas syringae pv. tagetis]RMW18978.1 DnaJ domain-containing protein [Pseudomonas syringae pv. tagetis]UNB66396.1 J domain-containing protein [Pseudomonas syringae pv. tagetis]